MSEPTQAQINAQIGNATRELAPGTTWKYHQPDGIEFLEWMDDAQLRPSDAEILAKATELAARVNQ